MRSREEVMKKSQEFPVGERATRGEALILEVLLDIRDMLTPQPALNAVIQAMNEEMDAIHRQNPDGA